jgi:hypothetical protein
LTFIRLSKGLNPIRTVLLRSLLSPHTPRNIASVLTLGEKHQVGEMIYY